MIGCDEIFKYKNKKLSEYINYPRQIVTPLSPYFLSFSTSRHFTKKGCALIMTQPNQFTLRYSKIFLPHLKIFP